MRYRYLPIVLLFGACAVAAQESRMFVEGVHCVGGRFGLVIPNDVRVLKKLANILREEILEVERWDGYTATRKRIYFEGLTLGLIEFSNDPSRFMVTSADLTGPNWNRISPFKLRRPLSEAASVLGEHARTDPELLRTYGSENDSVKVHASRGLVTRVSYECYSG